MRDTKGAWSDDFTEPGAENPYTLYTYIIMPLLASFFLPSDISFKNIYIHSAKFSRICKIFLGPRKFAV